MDSVLLLGIENEKFPAFLQKMGYEVTAKAKEQSIADVVSQKLFDLIVLEENLDIDCLDLCQFLRSEEKTKTVPILYVGCDEDTEQKLIDNGIARVNTVSAPYKLGSLASKIATELRLRKVAGADEETASIGEINARLRELNERFSKELQEARSLQMSLVPSSLPKDERMDIACAYQPLEEVGGDWFYVEMLSSGKLSVQIADVTGHGLSAAFIACITKLALRAADKEVPAELLQEMNRLMEPIIPNGKFVTVFSYLYCPETGELKYARGGHPPALLVKRQTGEVKHLKGDGFAIGFFDEAMYSDETDMLDEGDILMVYTDVLPESQNMNGDTYDYDRMCDVLLKSTPGTSSAELLQMVLDDFDDFREGRLIKDDVTAIVLQRLK